MLRLQHNQRATRVSEGHLHAIDAAHHSQGHLPHRMRHPLERQAPLAARRPRPIREQARLAEVQVAPTRGGARVAHAHDRAHFASAAGRAHVHVRILIKHLHRNALARGRRLEHSWRGDDYSG